MTITVTTDEELAVLLGTLGDTADEVADKLRATGIKGRRHASCACPVAKWLTRETDVKCAAVTIIEVNLWDNAEDPGHRTTTPPQIAEFVRFFDSGVYLDLVEQDAAS